MTINGTDIYLVRENLDDTSEYSPGPFMIVVMNAVGSEDLVRLLKSPAVSVVASEMYFGSKNFPLEELIYGAIQKHGTVVYRSNSFRVEGQDRDWQNRHFLIGTAISSIFNEIVSGSSSRITSEKFVQVVINSLLDTVKDEHVDLLINAFSGELTIENERRVNKITHIVRDLIRVFFKDLKEEHLKRVRALKEIMEL